MDVLDSQGLKLATLEPFTTNDPLNLSGGLRAERLSPGTAFQVGTPQDLLTIQAALTGESRNSTDLIAATTATRTSLNSGDSITGYVNRRGDHDWFRVQLTAGSTYQINLNRIGGRLDPLIGLRSSSGALISLNDDANGSQNSQIRFTATTSGTYFLDVGAYANASTGQYRLLLNRVAGDQYSADTRTTGTLAAGGSVSSTIDSLGDHDWFRIALNAGRTYTFNLSQTGTEALANPLLSLRNSSGDLLVSNDDANGTWDSQISFTASSGGTYYLDAGAFADSGTGHYRLTMAEQVIDLYSADTGTSGSLAAGSSITSTIDSLGDHDWFRIELTAGTTYRFNLNQSGSQALANPLLSLRDSNGNALVSNDDANGGTDAQITVTATSSDTYYLDAGASSDGGTGQYQLLMTQVANDRISADTDTIGTISTGASVSSTIDSLGDHDWFRIALNAGRTYTFNLNRIGTQGLADPLLTLRNSSGIVLVSNDDANNTLDSQISFTATSSGTYYLDAGAYDNGGIGDYQLLAAEVGTPTPGYSSSNGYGEANVKRALESMLSVSLPSVEDLGGVFWGLDRLGAPEVWNAGYTGTGITVAVVDTGVDYTHRDLDGNIWINSGEIAGNGIDDDGNGYIDDIRGWNFDSNTNNVMDDNSHGTHVAGTIAGENNEFGITGVAYNARIMAVKVLSAGGSGTLTAVANGIRYAANNGARVINLSLGGGGSSELLAAVSYATSRGAVVVMAAGNEAAASPGSPASYAQSYGLAVGAIDSAGNLASFSNRAGSTPLDYVTAAGVSVFSSVPGGGFASYSGTSMATPHIAGAMALLQQANIQNNRGLSVAALETLLTSTASNGLAATPRLSAGTTGSATITSQRTIRGRALAAEAVMETRPALLADGRLTAQAGGLGREPGTVGDHLPPVGQRPELRPDAALVSQHRPGGRSVSASAGAPSIADAVVQAMASLNGRRPTTPSSDPLTGLGHDPDSVPTPWSLVRF